MSELLDPDDRAFADDQAHDAGSDRGQGEPDDLPDDYGLDEQTDSLAAGDAPGDVCSHPPSQRRMTEDGEQVCTACGSVIDVPQAIVPKDRPGGTDPTMREGRTVGLRHVNYADGATSRPYTPEQVELEIVRILAQIEKGAGWLTTKEEERAAAKLQYELAFARARFASNARSAEQRNDEAMLECRDLYSEWQMLELTCRTAREGMHNLRSMLNGFQSVARSVGVALGAYR